MTGSIVLVSCLFVAQGGTGAAADLDATVRRLVRQLDANELAQRDAAEAELIRLGPSVIDLLPELTDPTSAEVRQRIERIRQRVQQAAAEAAVEPSRVTLENSAIPLSKCLEEIQRQTGNRIKDLRGQLGQEQSDPALAVSFQNTPFWTALDEVLRQAGLALYPFGAEGALGVVKRSEGAAEDSLSSTSGPVRFVPLELVARRGFASSAETSLLVRLGVVWEPRLTPISLKQRLSAVEAVDERGRSLAAHSDEAALEVAVNSQSPAVELTIPLALPPRDARQIARLSGTLDAVLPGRIETFRFDRLLETKDVKKRAGGATVTLVQVRKNAEVWEVWIRVEFDKTSGALESYRGWVFQNEAYLEGADGKRIDHDGFETAERTENSVGLAYLFGLDEPPAKCVFVYKTPGAIVSQSIRYEIKGLALP